MRKALNIKKKKKRDNVTTFISKLMSCKKSRDSSYESKTQYIIICQLHLKFLLQIRNFHRLTLLLFEAMLEHIYLPLKPSLSFIISTQESFYNTRSLQSKEKILLTRLGLSYLYPASSARSSNFGSIVLFY